MPTDVTISQAIEGYFLAAQARRLSSHTLADYGHTFGRFLEYLGEDVQLAEITAADIRAFLNELEGLSKKTVLNYHTGLSALWTWAIKEELVDRHVVREVDAPKPEQRAVMPYTKDDVQGMLAACEYTRSYNRPGMAKCRNKRPTELRDKAILTLLVDTGIRASELCDLRILHCDLKNQRIRVMGKGRRERTIPISPRTAQVMWRYLATREDRGNTGAFLFVTGRGTAFNRHVLKRLVTRLGKRADVQGANVHRFRHTFAIQFLRNRGNPFALQRMLGHQSLEMVNRYLAIVQGDVDAAHQDASPVANWLI